MRRAIAIHALVAWSIVVGLDRAWPVWPVHVLAAAALAVIAAMTFLAVMAARKR